jgi:hypothetical protein
MKRHLFHLFFLACLAAALIGAGLPAARNSSAEAQPVYQIVWGVLPAGGGLSSAGHYTAHSTVGLPVSGVSSAGKYRLEARVVYSTFAPVAFLPLIEVP